MGAYLARLVRRLDDGDDSAVDRFSIVEYGQQPREVARAVMDGWRSV